MDDDKEKVRSRVNIVDVVGRKVNLKKSGRGFTGLCPFHDDKNPSFSVNPTTGTYRCWSCGAKGDVFTFVMESERVGFREALEALAVEAGVTLTKHASDPDQALRQRRESAMALAQEFFVEHLQKSKVAQDYCANRGITPETIAQWGLGFGPPLGEALAVHLKKAGHSLQECQELFLVERDPGGGYFDRFRGRLMFPIHDERGRLVAFGGRIIGDGIPKYINSSDTPLFSKRRTLYGMHKARGKMAESGRAVLVEGYLDVIACHAAGVEEAVASLGTSLSPEHADLIKRWAKEVVILYDADTAGQKAADRGEEILAAAGLRVRIALMPPGADPDTLLRTAGPEAVRKAVEGGLSPTEFRMSQLRQKHPPTSDEFWAEAYQILAQAGSALEIERYATELAAVYPGIRDHVAAIRIIKREIAAMRRQRTTPDAPERRGVVRIPKAPVHPWEATVLRALLDPKLQKRAYEVLAEDLFFTGAGMESVADLERVAMQIQTGTPASSWVPLVPEHTRDNLEKLEQAAIIPVKEEELMDAVNRLREKKTVRTIQALRLGDSNEEVDLAKIQSALENLKNKDLS